MGFPKDLLLPFSRVSLNAAVVSFPDIIKTTTKSLVFICVKLRREGFGGGGGEGGREEEEEEGGIGGGGSLL
jgi:uncharacterized spore protein YtfJ